MYRSVYCLYRSSRVLPTVGTYLAGGFGTRLSEDTSAKPTPMVESGEKPVLWHSMNIYPVHGIDELLYQATATSPLTPFSRTHGRLATVTTVRSPAGFFRIACKGDQGTEIF
jgi:hypothetical protein